MDEQKNDLTTIDALNMAIEALSEKAEIYHFDQRAVDTFGNKAPRDSQRRAKKRKDIFIAIKHLQRIKHAERG